ncbi:MAG: hypothetical protein JNK67_32310 [Alphaproteobacteria bacterium]|nr:hypothetical protein [Alphaproteobacteria bacterium]
MTRPAPEEAPLPSNRSFGRLFVIVFGLVALWSWWRGGAWLPVWLGLSAATLVVTLVAPDRLAPLNRLWMRFAELLHRVVSPVMLGVIYFIVLTPFALVMRVRGRDPLSRRFEPGMKSYWVARDPPGPDPKTLPNQF